MSRFKSIRNKINKNSSMLVDEKLAALDKELEKTGMLSEVMTTDNVLSSSEYVPPQERIVSDVPNSSGIGGEGFTQSSAGSGTEGDPPNHSDMSDLYNSDVGHPIYKATSYNGVGSFGIVIGPSFGAGTTYGIIEGGNTYRAILGGFLAGGTRGSANYKAIYDAKVESGSSQEQIDDAKEHWQLAVQVEAALIEIGYDNSRFNVPWKAWRSPILFEDLSGVPSFNHPTKGLIYLVQFNLLGEVNRYTSQEPRPATTTNPQRRGLEDDPIFPGPIATLFELGQRGFEWLKEKAEEALDNIKDTFGYRAEIALSVMNDEEFVRTNDEVTDREKDDLKNGLDPDEVPINNEETGYSDDNFYEDEKGNIVKKPKNPLDDIDITEPNWQEKITPEVQKKYNEWQKVEEEHPDNTDFVSKVQNEKGDGEKVTAAEVGGLAGRGQAHHEFVNPGNGEEPYYHYKDYAYASSDSKDPVEFPNKTDAAAAAAASAASGGSNIKDKYGENITGMSIVEVNIPYSEWTKEMKKSFHERTGTKPPTTNESYITEGVGLGLYEPEAMNVDLADIRKGVMPEYPKKPPAEMIDGYHEKSPLKPKPLENEPYVKITKADLIRNHRLKPKEADEMMDTINMVNAHIKAHPEDLIHAQMRYPKDDPRLAELNWKMDQMLGASKEYMDSNFKENKKLFKRATEHTLKNIKVTDPKYVQQKYDELRGTIKPKKTKLVGRLGKHLNKYESKSLFKHVNSKNFKKINERKIERKEQVKQIQKEIEIEFQEKKNDWRKDLGNNTY